MQFYTTADGGSSKSERMRIDSSGTIQVKGDGGNNNKIYGFDGADLAWILGNNNSDDPEFNNFRSGNLLFKTNGSERLRITSSGNVGIGTTSPSQILHLNAANPFLEIQGTSNSGDAGIFLNAGGNHWLLRSDNSASGSTFSIKSGDTSSSTHRLLIEFVWDRNFRFTF